MATYTSSAQQHILIDNIHGRSALGRFERLRQSTACFLNERAVMPTSIALPPGPNYRRQFISSYLENAQGMLLGDHDLLTSETTAAAGHIMVEMTRGAIDSIAIYAGHQVDVVLSFIMEDLLCLGVRFTTGNEDFANGVLRDLCY